MNNNQQGGDDQQQAGGPIDIGAALGAHETRRRATELPLYYGRADKDVCTAQDLITRFETAATIAGWDADERKCQQFYLILRDNALRWWKTLGRIPDFDMTDWASVKRDFLRAYAPKHTARSACANLQELYQKNGEAVQDFYLRCMTSYDKLEEIMDPGMLTTRRVIAGVTQDQRDQCKKEGIDDTFRFVMQQIFIAGLREEIRLKTMEANPRALQETLEVAQQMELIVGDRRVKGQVTAVKDEYFTEDEEEEEEEELSADELIALEKVNAVFKRNGKSFGRFIKRGGFRNFSRNTPNRMNPNIVCHGCGKKGHIIKNCYSKKKRTNAIRDPEDEEESSEEEDDIQKFYGVSSISKKSLNY